MGDVNCRMKDGIYYGVPATILTKGMIERMKREMTHMRVKNRNRIPLYTMLDGRLVSHFSMHEFENRDGLVMIHPAVLAGLERVRRQLNEMFIMEVAIIVRDAVRTQQDLERLAERYGWVDEGGTVSRDSKHLAKYGGIAVDIVATRRIPGNVPQKVVGKVCRKCFDWVKDDYPDGHVHADNRDGGQGNVGNS